VKKFITFNRSSGYKEDVNFLLVMFFPVVALVDYLLNDVSVWPYNKNDCIVFGLKHFRVAEDHLFVYFAGVWEHSDYEA